MADALKQYLELLGAQVAGPAATTAEATKLMTERLPHVALVDFHLRGEFLWLNCAASRQRRARHHAFRLFRVSRTSFTGGGNNGGETDQRSAASSISEADIKSRSVKSGDDRHASARGRGRGYAIRQQIAARPGFDPTVYVSLQIGNKDGQIPELLALSILFSPTVCS